VRAAAVRYESARPGLGESFLRAVDGAFRDIDERPLAWPIWRDGLPYRRYVLRKFPFVVFFVAEPSPEVFAVAHAKRRPGDWLPTS
jgi:hypothetical protein